MDPAPYPNYFWQTSLIRLRPLRPEDAEKKHREWLDYARPYLADGSTHLST